MVYLIELSAWAVAVAGGVIAWHLYMRTVWRALAR
jgi:hypothetical protein